MKILKVLLIVLLIIAGLLLIVPVFLPGEATISAQTEIALPPEAVFHQTASFADRAAWDPWIQMEPGATVTINPREGYVGSTYAWKGEKIGNGKMRVDSVHFPDYIASSIWFGESEEPAQVEWLLEAQDGGTQVTWKFTSEGSYPFGRFMLLFMKGPLQSSFTSGLSGYKDFLEANPPRMYDLSEIGIEKSYDTDAMVIPVTGTMEEVAAQMGTGFPVLMEVLQEQGLEPNGPPFAHYLDFDEETGVSNVLLAIPVTRKGQPDGAVRPAYYPAIEAVAATHTGSYAYLPESYEALTSYAAANDLELTGEAFEVYLVPMMESPNPMEWKTMIAFPLKK